MRVKFLIPVLALLFCACEEGKFTGANGILSEDKSETSSGDNRTIESSEEKSVKADDDDLTKQPDAVADECIKNDRRLDNMKFRVESNILVVTGGILDNELVLTSVKTPGHVLVDDTSGKPILFTCLNGIIFSGESGSDKLHYVFAKSLFLRFDQKDGFDIAFDGGAFQDSVLAEGEGDPNDPIENETVGVNGAILYQTKNLKNNSVHLDNLP